MLSFPFLVNGAGVGAAIAHTFLREPFLLLFFLTVGLVPRLGLGPSTGITGSRSWVPRILFFMNPLNIIASIGATSRLRQSLPIEGLTTKISIHSLRSIVLCATTSEKSRIVWQHSQGQERSQMWVLLTHHADLPSGRWQPRVSNRLFSTSRA